MDQQELWMVFAKTGRVEDYLRYAQAVMQKEPPKKEESTHGTDDHGTDRSRTQYRGG